MLLVCTLGVGTGFYLDVNNAGLFHLNKVRFNDDRLCNTMLWFFLKDISRIIMISVITVRTLNSINELKQLIEYYI